MRIKKIAIASLIGIILILPNLALAETLVVESEADAQLLFGNKDVNYGNGTNEGKIIIHSGTEPIRGILRFDFSALPDDAIITNATLSLYCWADPCPADRTYRVYEITQGGWLEMETTWNSYKTGFAWDTAGGDYTTLNGTYMNTTTGIGWKNWTGMYDLIQHFRTEHSEIANILIKDGVENTDPSVRTHFRSREFGSNAPKLTINYTLPVCGNDIKEGGEVCDGIDLGGETCVSQGFEGGTLACAVGCGSFDTSSCHYIPAGSGNILPVGTDFPVSALAYVGELFGDIYPYIGVLVGIPLAFWIIGSIIDTAKKKKRGRKFN